MSTSAEAILFYGYIQPESDKQALQELREDEDETPWTATHIKRAYGCIGGIHGYDENLGHYVAVEESRHSAEWEGIVKLSPTTFEIHQEWDTQLAQYASKHKLDLTGLHPSWYLVCLYF